ncbi:MAG TPA: ATP-binding protein [Planctomycetota bacterium]
MTISSLPVGSGPCSCVLTQRDVKLIVVTGGPGAGKTAVLEMARRSLCKHIAILPEAAGIVFGGGFPRLESTAGRCASQRAIFHVQRELEALALGSGKDIAVALCDRGTIDGAAYWPEEAGSYWQALATSLAAELDRYAAVIHLRTPAAGQGFNQSNPLRRETAEQAAVLDARIAEAWGRHARRTEIPNHSDFLEKARRVLECVRAELPTCYRGHDLDLPRPPGQAL